MRVTTAGFDTQCLEGMVPHFADDDGEASAKKLLYVFVRVRERTSISSPRQAGSTGAVTSALVQRMKVLAAKIDDTRGRTAMDRWALLNELGGLNEWQPMGFFKALALKPLKSVKVE
jgi:hypothetical protein